jgi:hypothetical protein
MRHSTGVAKAQREQQRRDKRAKRDARRAAKRSLEKIRPPPAREEQAHARQA